MTRALISHIIFLIFLLLGASSVSAAVYSEVQLKKLVVGNTLIARTRQGASWRMYASANGVAAFHFASGLVQKGRYSISGSEICFQLPDVEQDCRVVRSTGEGYAEWVLAEDRQTVSSHIFKYASGDKYGINSLSNGNFHPIVSLSDPFEEGSHADFGERWIQVYSRDNISDAQLIAQEVETVWPHTEIFLSRNGWYAIAIGRVKKSNAERYLEEWKSEGRIPQDSIHVAGIHYRHRIPVSSFRPPRETIKVARRPEASQSTSYSSNTRPRACRRISSYCIELSGAVAACGFAAQEGLDRAFNTNTGVAGGVATSVACTALISDMEGLSVSPSDLMLAIVSGAAGEAAGDAFARGDVGEGLLASFFALGGMYASALSCESTLRTACR